VTFQGSTDLIQSLGMAEGELRQCFSSMQDPGEDGLAVHAQDSLQLVVNLLDSFLIRNLGSFVSTILDGTSKQHGVGGGQRPSNLLLTQVQASITVASFRGTTKPCPFKGCVNSPSL